MTAIRHITVLFFFMVTAFSGFATASEEKKSEVLATVKEIYVKGSINNDKLFLVLGMEDGLKIFKEGMKNAINIKALKRIGSDTASGLNRTRRFIYNREHDLDIIDIVGDGFRISKDASGEILSAPFKSLKKIPQAYSISMSSARNARANSSNSIAGVTKYAGHAVWANVKGAYYLVIEAPTVFVAKVATTVLAVPATAAIGVVGVPIGITLNFGGKAVRLGYQAVKGIVAGSFAIGALTYSAASTTIAAAATLTAAVAISGVRIVVKALALPFTSRKKARLRFETTIHYKKIADLRKAFIDSRFGNEADMVVANENRVAFTINLYQTIDDRRMKSVVIKVKPIKSNNLDKQILQINTHYTPKFFKVLLGKTGLSKKALTELLRKNLKPVVEEIVKKVEEEIAE